jgi:hypothetical protein
MPLEPQIEFRDDHIYVYLPEDYDFNPAGRGGIWSRLKSLCEENKTCRVLVEGRLPEIERETADVIDAGIHTGAVPKLWLAFHFENFVESEQSEVFEAVAASKGVRVKHFSNREKALHWLRNNSPS